MGWLEPHKARINRRELLSFEGGVINFMDVVDAIPLYRSNLIIYTDNNYNNLQSFQPCKLARADHETASYKMVNSYNLAKSPKPAD